MLYPLNLVSGFREVECEPISIKSFSRFSGSFEPIFDSRLGGQYRLIYMPPQALKSKSDQNNSKTRRKILLR